MAINGGFPIGYQPAQLYYPYAQPVQPQPQQAGMTPPTVHADIVQVDGEQAAMAYPVAAGASQMMISKDETMIFVKTATATGQSSVDVFVKRPPAPPKPEVDMSLYITRDELEKRLADLMNGGGES